MTDRPPDDEPLRPEDKTPVDLGSAAEVGDHHSDLFFAAVETTRMPMVVTDPRQLDNPIIFANHAFRRMTGYASEELIGRNCRFLQGPETDAGTLAEVRRAVGEHREIATEILNYRKNGSTFWNALYLSPVYNRSGDLVYYFGSQLDVSRRRDAEDALRQSQKMEALGQLTGGIAHDFNNLLQVMVGYVSIMLNALEKPEVDRARIRRGAEAIQAATGRAATLTQQLLAFARKQRLEGRTLNLNALIEGMRDLTDRTFAEAVSVQTRLAPDLWNCRVDATQAEVAILNVLINARDAMEGLANATISVTTANQVTGEDDAAPGTLRPGRYAVVTITDTGSGMPPDILARVLDPFFTTKEEGKGTGLGLSMVYGFMRQSNGTVHITSDVGRGTTVQLYFPAVEDEIRAGPRATSRLVERTGTESVLVVEDREEVAELARAILEDYGYTVDVAFNGRDALARLNAGTFDLLFSDLIMPGGMNGVVLAREARSRQHGLKVLLTTGYAEASIERTDAGGSEFEMIPKPYNRTELARKVRQVLDGPTGVG